MDEKTYFEYHRRLTQAECRYAAASICSAIAQEHFDFAKLYELLSERAQHGAMASFVAYLNETERLLKLSIGK